MKTIFRESTEKNNGFSIKDILKPMEESELQSIVLCDEELEKKEEESIKNQIKRFKERQEEEIKIEQIKEPK